MSEIEETDESRGEENHSVKIFCRNCDEVLNADSPVEQNDVVLCLGCGIVSVIDNFLARQPTDKEASEIRPMLTELFLGLLAK